MNQNRQINHRLLKRACLTMCLRRSGPYCRLAVRRRRCGPDPSINTADAETIARELNGCR